MKILAYKGPIKVVMESNIIGYVDKRIERSKGPREKVRDAKEAKKWGKLLKKFVKNDYPRYCVKYAEVDLKDGKAKLGVRFIGDDYYLGVRNVVKDVFVEGAVEEIPHLIEKLKQVVGKPFLFKRWHQLTKQDLADIVCNERAFFRSLIRHPRMTKAILLMIVSRYPDLKDEVMEQLKKEEASKEEEETLEWLRKEWQSLDWENEESKVQELLDIFWSLDIVAKRFERWVKTRYGKNVWDHIDDYDRYGYYSNEFAEEVLTQKRRVRL